MSLNNNPSAEQVKSALHNEEYDARPKSLTGHLFLIDDRFPSAVYKVLSSQVRLRCAKVVTDEVDYDMSRHRFDASFQLITGPPSRCNAHLTLDELRKYIRMKDRVYFGPLPPSYPLPPSPLIPRAERGRTGLTARFEAGRLADAKRKFNPTESAPQADIYQAGHITESVISPAVVTTVGTIENAEEGKRGRSPEREVES
jgi:hypothetical protein